MVSIERKNALLSVYHKDGIEDFARELVAMGWNLYSSTGTKARIENAGIPVTDVSTLVGGEAILGHRVVTLSREKSAALLAKDTSDDIQELHKRKIPWIDLVCVDMYPLEEEVNNPSATTESVIEQTDIGGPNMLSEAAKGRRIVIADPADRERVLEWLKAGCPDNDVFRNDLAAKANKIVANYRLLTARYHSKGKYDGMIGTKMLDCQYGENAWQSPAGLWSTETDDPLGLDKFQVLEGVPSYNNWVDIDRQLQTITHMAAGFEKNFGHVPYFALAVKHGNACGASFGNDQEDVLKKMVTGDRRAIFGGVVMTNFPLTEDLARILVRYDSDGGRRILDCVVAPGFSEGVVKILSRKDARCKMLINPALAALSIASLDTASRRRQVRGGFLGQPNYTYILDEEDEAVEKRGTISIQYQKDLVFAWAIGSTSNSNTITLVKDRQLVGNGVGQQDRVGCSELALKRAHDAGHSTNKPSVVLEENGDFVRVDYFVEGAVAYSDSFFPFADGLEVLARAGVLAVFATTGSARDGEVQEAASNAQVALLQMPDKLARGFFNH